MVRLQDGATDVVELMEAYFKRHGKEECTVLRGYRATSIKKKATDKVG